MSIANDDGLLAHLSAYVAGSGARIGDLEQQLQVERAAKETLQRDYDNLKAEHAALEEQYEALEGRYVALRQDGDISEENHDQSASLGSGIPPTSSPQPALTPSFAPVAGGVPVAFGPTKILKEKSEKALQNRCRNMLKNLPRDDKRPSMGDIHPICGIGLDFMAYMEEDPSTAACNHNISLAADTSLSSFVPNILFLRGRVRTISDMNIVAFGPLRRYDQDTQTWSESHELRNLVGETREVIIDRKSKQGKLLYVGTYTAYDMTRYFQNLPAPPKVDEATLIEDALGLPLPDSPMATRLLQDAFPAGFIAVEALGLHCVGFNREFYAALCARIGADPEVGPAMARKLEREAHREGGYTT
ncbi:hypothetical protein MKEN_00475800 [Mycena kentingensis (nom. inval.)]|nr:hypothetical protein MKEN_00475800 [Mycena kentingensis (nom. inval.)]